MGRGTLWDKLREFKQMLSGNTERNRIIVAPKAYRVSGPTPRLPEGWHEATYQRLLDDEVICKRCGGHVMAASGPLKEGMCGTCYYQSQAEDRIA